MLTHNLKHFRARAISVHAAVWSSCEKLYLHNDPAQPENEWGVRVSVRPGVDGPSQAGTPGFDIPSLMRLGHFPRINLLKVDVEGAEEQIFSGDCEWLALVDFIAIECHGVTCRETVARTLQKNDFVMQKRGEVYFARKTLPGEK